MTTHETTDSLDFYLHGIIGVDYVLHLSTTLAASSTRFNIEREERTAGGLMWRTAQKMACDTKYRIALSGNAVGEDSNGRLVARESESQKFAWQKNIAPLETPYWVILKSVDAPPTVLARQQAAQQNDREQFLDAARIPPKSWPRAKMICCSDELPFSALWLARQAKIDNVPFYLARSGDAPDDIEAQKALEEVARLSTKVWSRPEDTTPWSSALMLFLLAELWHSEER